MNVVLTDANGWTSGSLLLARSFVERWRGLKGPAASSGLLMKTRSVHGFGMPESFRAVGLSRDLKIVGSKQVAPRRLAWFPTATFVLELPDAAELPPVGTQLSVQHV